MKILRRASLWADRLSRIINWIPGLADLLLRLVRWYSVRNELAPEMIKRLALVIRLIIRSQGKAIIRTPSRLVFNAYDQSQYVNQILLLKGPCMEYCWEPNSSRLLAELIRPDDRIVVAGANIGFETVIIGDRLRSGKGVCYAFEPIEANCRILRENVALNGLGAKIKVYSLALGDVDIEKCMHSAGPNSSLLFMNEAANCQKVSVRRLDTLWEKGEIEPIAGLVADVEGYELETIIGAEKLLSASPIRFILFEINGKTEEVCPGKTSRLLLYLAERDFQLFAIPDDYRGFQIPSLKQKRLLKIADPAYPFILSDRWFNVLAIQTPFLSELSQLI